MRVNSERLRYWRHKRVISRQELVKKAGIGRSTYNNLESGYKRTAKPETVRAIAGALRISPEKLVIPKAPEQEEDSEEAVALAAVR